MSYFANRQMCKNADLGKKKNIIARNWKAKVVDKYVIYKNSCNFDFWWFAWLSVVMVYFKATQHYR